MRTGIRLNIARRAMRKGPFDTNFVVLGHFLFF